MSTQTAPDRFLARENARIRWRLEGSGPAIVLLHGWALDLDYWNLVVPLLASRFSVLRFDRSGFGLSDGPPDIHRNVADLEALLQQAGIERAVLVGMSQGARLAIHFALAHPARVRALVLDGAPAFDAEPELPMAEFRRQLQTAGVAAMGSQIQAHPLMQLQVEDPQARHQLAQLLSRYQGHDLQHTRAASPAPALSRITAPVLVLNGAHDSAGRHDAAQRLATLLPHASRQQLPGAGHLAALDDPAGYALQVITFCDSLPP
jgi:3-oxoadipate enol-lactonase